MTRQALLEAGLAECGERGLEAPSLDAICARAGYTRGAFYVHFKNRDDFVEALMDWALSGVLDALLGAESDALCTVLERFSNAAWSGSWPMGSGQALPTERLAEALDRSPAIRERLSALLQRASLRLTKLALAGQVAAELRRDISATQISQLIISLATGAVILRQTGVPVDARRMHADLITMIQTRPARSHAYPLAQSG